MDLLGSAVGEIGTFPAVHAWARWHPFNSSGHDYHDMFDVDFTVADLSTSPATVTDRFTNMTLFSSMVVPMDT